MKKPLIIYLFIILLCACEERFEMELPFVNSNLIAVEAVLTNENKSQEIRITLPYQQLNGNPQPVSGAVISVQEGNGTTYIFQEVATNPGTYLSAPFQAVVGVTYTLKISVDGREIVASDRSEPVEPLESLQFQKVGDNYELILDEGGENANYIDHQLTWENTSSCTPGVLCHGRVIFYDLKNIDVNEIYKPGKTQFLFPVGTTITRKKYSVSTAYRTYLRSILSETEWRGGVFDVDRANSSTNLSKGATGFFAVTTVVSDVTVINP
jgi:hypothetical protein